MKIRQLYKCIIDRHDVWDYYNSNIIAPVLTDYKDCGRFITEVIKCSEKTNTELYRNIKELEDKSPQRLSHIVSTFFLGLWLFHNKQTSFIRRSITDELKKLDCFHDDPKEIDRQFSYIWFMASLFHDLGYPAEDCEEGKELPSIFIPYVKSVPVFYNDVFCSYYNYRKKKEHGIFAGLAFDNDLCEIRRLKEGTNEMGLNWRVELEDLYHYVAWIILAHNIWMIRKDKADEETLNKYHDAGLDDLILELDKDGLNVDYKIDFDNYPLFTLFCIVDTIEPLKSSSCLSDIDVQLKLGKIIIESNDSVYLRKIKGLNDWLTPTIEDKDRIIINLKM